MYLNKMYYGRTNEISNWGHLLELSPVNEQFSTKHTSHTYPQILKDLKKKNHFLFTK